MLRRDHIQVDEDKRRKLRRWLWLTCFLYKNKCNKCKVFKPVEITIWRGLR
jgi:hypothetical protein